MSLKGRHHVASEGRQAFPGADTFDAFISYARSDRDFADRLRSALTDRGRTVWFDEDDIAPGEVWNERISSAIESSDAFVIILSPDSVSSSQPETTDRLRG